jgi:hypothetical protein
MEKNAVEAKKEKKGARGEIQASYPVQKVRCWRGIFATFYFKEFFYRVVGGFFVLFAKKKLKLGVHLQSSWSCSN